MEDGSEGRVVEEDGVVRKYGAEECQRKARGRVRTCESQLVKRDCDGGAAGGWQGGSVH